MILNKNKTILVTCALPYANGSIHLGHLLEHIQADIWVRYQRMKGENIFFICADDAHGTAIMLKSKELKITPEKLIDQMIQEHKQDFKNFSINHDNYYSTHSVENKILTEKTYFLLKKQGFIKSKIITQLFDSEYKMFLPDRFIKGNCPQCMANDQYGDHCEICGATYEQKKLINPYSVISKTKPKTKKTKHFFFDLPLFSDILKTWIHSNALQKQISNKMQEWLNIGLQPWDITRDAPYFGFKIPNKKNKYFYVWLDAPLGYISTFQNLCKTNLNINFNDFWNKNSKTELYHFIGKDISYFHCLFWPAILEAINYRKPNNIFVHGYLTINGNKMSKTRGTFITANTYIKHLDSDYLRYYFATKLSNKINDINFNLDDFKNRINNDLVNNVINIAARNALFINKYFNNILSPIILNMYLYNQFVIEAKYIEDKYYQRDYNKVTHKIIKLADIANQYINNQAPWIMIKEKNKMKDVHEICSLGINIFRILMTYLKPILPKLTKRTEKFLNISLKWEDIYYPLRNHKINKFNRLLKRIEQKNIENITILSKNIKIN